MSSNHNEDNPTLAECEAMWEVINDDDVMVMSLERIHCALMRFLRREKVGSSGLESGFNPQGEYNNVPTMESVDNIDWRGILVNKPSTTERYHCIPDTLALILTLTQWVCAITTFCL